MNHTIKGILVVAAITSMLVLGAIMIPLAQNTYASSHRHQDNIANQQDDTYRSPGSESTNVVVQESGKGNSATAFSDQSSNLKQQNQPTLQQQGPQANEDKDTKFPITLNVLPDQRITNTNVNPNRNTASSNSGSASDASNDNTINNTALARQRQAEASCAVALTCPEGSTTVTRPPDPCPHSPYTDFVAGTGCQDDEPQTTCNPPTIGGFIASPNDGTCTAHAPIGDNGDVFGSECDKIPGSTRSGSQAAGWTCNFPSTETCPTPTGSTQTPAVAENGRCTIQPGEA